MSEDPKVDDVLTSEGEARVGADEEKDLEKLLAASRNSDSAEHALPSQTLCSDASNCVGAAAEGGYNFTVRMVGGAEMVVKVRKGSTTQDLDAQICAQCTGTVPPHRIVWEAIVLPLQEPCRLESLSIPLDAELLFVPLPKPILHTQIPCNCRALLDRLGVQQTRALSGMKEVSCMDFALVPNDVEQKAMQLHELKQKSSRPRREVVVFSNVSIAPELDKALLSALGITKHSWRNARLYKVGKVLDDGLGDRCPRTMSELFTLSGYYLEEAEVEFLETHTSDHFMLSFRDLRQAPVLMGGWHSEHIICICGNFDLKSESSDV